MRQLFLLFLFASVALIGCSAAESDEHSHEDEQEVIVTTLDEFRFEPATIEVVAGRPVELTLVNEGALDHDFSIVEIPLAGEVETHSEEEAHDEHEMEIDEDELMVHISATPNDRQTATFTPAEPGEYQIVCTVPGHREAGMVATLLVTAP